MQQHLFHIHIFKMNIKGNSAQTEALREETGLKKFAHKWNKQLVNPEGDAEYPGIEFRLLFLVLFMTEIH